MSLINALFRKAHEASHISEAAASLVDVLKTRPEEWRLEDGGHYLSNAQIRVRIWVSNDDYGLRVEADGERWSPTGPERNAIWAASRELMDAQGRNSARRMARRIADRLQA